MRIADVLRNKGAGVLTVSPEMTVAELLTGLATRNVGAMVVVGPDGPIGIVVSIGDVVKTRLEELEAQQEQLEAYITQG
jgi:CBS domain-containing protein